VKPLPAQSARSHGSDEYVSGAFESAPDQQRSRDLPNISRCGQPSTPQPPVASGGKDRQS